MVLWLKCETIGDNRFVNTFDKGTELDFVGFWPTLVSHSYWRFDIFFFFIIGDNYLVE